MILGRLAVSGLVVGACALAIGCGDSPDAGSRTPQPPAAASPSAETNPPRSAANAFIGSIAVDPADGTVLPRHRVRAPPGRSWARTLLRGPLRNQTHRELVYRPLQLYKRSQLLIRVDNETLPVAAMRISNPDRTAVRVQR